VKELEQCVGHFVGHRNLYMMKDVTFVTKFFQKQKRNWCQWTALVSLFKLNILFYFKRNVRMEFQGGSVNAKNFGSR
tara:strand:- start:284 stop:514 length:231 start_codon:yes stop_codon:yes gene_type:complete